jgi:hypothetical protein
MTSNLPEAASYEMRSALDKHPEGYPQACLLYPGPAHDACLVVDACAHYILKGGFPPQKSTAASAMDSSGYSDDARWRLETQQC